MNKKVSHIKSLAGILAVFFLFNVVIPHSLHFLGHHYGEQEVVAAQKHQAHSKQDNPLSGKQDENRRLYSEFNDENDDESQNSICFLCPDWKSGGLNVISAGDQLRYDHNCSCNKGKSLPIYLSNRALLI